jgi:hypothetical protein
MERLATSQFHFIFTRVEVSEEHIFSFQSNEGGREGGDLRGLIVILFEITMEKSIFGSRVF